VSLAGVGNVDTAVMSGPGEGITAGREGHSVNPAPTRGAVFTTDLVEGELVTPNVGGAPDS
jgi:hypothetical protein